MRYCEKSIRESCSSNEQILRKIYENMMKTRKQDKVKYRPLTKNEYLYDVYLPGVDFTQLFSEFEDGDYVYVTFDAEGPFEKTVIYNIYKSSPAELYCNGEAVAYCERPDGSLDAEVDLGPKSNTFIMKITAKDGLFQTYFKFLMKEIRMMPRNYVYNTRRYIELDGFKGQKDIAISRLYKKSEAAPDISKEAIDWIYPVKPEQSNCKKFAFKDWIANGYTAYAYTCFEGKLTLNHQSPLKVFADGKEIYCAEEGTFLAEFGKETALLIKSRRGKEDWGFESISEGVHSLPFAETDNCSDLKWLWIGPFGRMEEPIDHPYPPEINLQFADAYPTVNGDVVYWNFYREKTTLYQQLTTIFYGQWFYPMMVGMNGLRVLADKLGIREIYDYFTGGMKILAQHRKYAGYEYKNSNNSDMIPGSAKLDRLDPIGTIGMNMAEYYLMTADKSAEVMLLTLADAMMENVPRLEDGTFNRIDTMWTDDMYMSLPFLARLGVVTGDPKYYDEAVRQIKGFAKRMYMEDKKLFSHIWYPPEKDRNNIPWGRGNGWAFLAMSEVLLYMPEDYAGREDILALFRDFAVGIIAHRDREEGIWHQVVSNPASYIETSGSAMFITALARGIRLGWLSEDYTEEVLDAWKALTEKCIDDEGNIYGVCQGSGCKRDESYYMQLGTIKNDDHGIGIVLGAGVEIMNLLGDYGLAEMR